MKITASQKKYFIGIDIGGTKCAVVVGDRDFNIHEKLSFETRTERGYPLIIGEFQEKIDSLLTRFPLDEVARMGISCGGPLDSDGGVIYSPPNLPGWDAVPIIDLFQEKYGIPVFIQNDANACALAEWYKGAGKGTRNMVFLTFGTGMGAGLILNGQIYAGTNDLGGEVGHIRLEEEGPVGFGKAGSFEGFCSGGGIAQMGRAFVEKKQAEGQTVDFCMGLELEKLDAKIIAMAAEKGDPVAGEIIRISAEYLGKGLAIIIDMLNPECIVIGSIYARNETLFKPHMDRILKMEAIPSALEVCTVKPALLGDSIGDYAALCVAINGNQK